MANIKSAEKRIDVNKRNTMRNKINTSKLKTPRKKYNKAIEQKDIEAAENLLPKTMEVIDKSVTKGAIHKNAANNRKSRLSAKLDNLKNEVK